MTNQTLDDASTPASSSSSTAEQCFFLQNLPLEIRNKVYDLCACFPANSTIYAPAIQEGPSRVKEYSPTIFAPILHASYALHGPEYRVLNPLLPNQTAFLLAFTCREIRTETFSRYFGSNMWSFPAGYEMQLFLSGIGKVFVKELRKLEFIWEGEDPKGQMLALAECVNLRTLPIAIDKRKMTGGSIYSAVGIGTLLQIRGLRELDVKVRQITCWHGRQNVTAEFEKDVNRAPTWQISFTAKQVADFEAILKRELRRDRLEVGKLRDVEKVEETERAIGITETEWIRKARVAKFGKK